MGHVNLRAAACLKTLNLTIRFILFFREGLYNFSLQMLLSKVQFQVSMDQEVS